MQAHREGGSLRTSCTPHTNLCRGINVEIIFKDITGGKLLSVPSKHCNIRTLNFLR
jgi:hypothetical protein